MFSCRLAGCTFTSESTVGRTVHEGAHLRRGEATRNASDVLLKVFFLWVASHPIFASVQLRERSSCCKKSENLWLDWGVCGHSRELMAKSFLAVVAAAFVTATASAQASSPATAPTANPKPLTLPFVGVGFGQPSGVLTHQRKPIERVESLAWMRQIYVPGSRRFHFYIKPIGSIADYIGFDTTDGKVTAMGVYFPKMDKQKLAIVAKRFESAIASASMPLKPLVKPMLNMSSSEGVIVVIWDDTELWIAANHPTAAIADAIRDHQLVLGMTEREANASMPPELFNLRITNDNGERRLFDWQDLRATGGVGVLPSGRMISLPPPQAPHYLAWFDREKLVEIISQPIKGIKKPM
jgi:hypothetical protein